MAQYIMYNVLWDTVEPFTQYIMDNYSLTPNNISLFTKTQKSLILRKQNYRFLKGHLSWRKIETCSCTQWHKMKIHNVILNKLCNIFSENIFQKKENNEKMLDKRLIKLLVLSLFYFILCTSVFLSYICLIPNADMFQ